jgi:hypothetical protein
MAARAIREGYGNLTTSVIAEAQKTAGERFPILFDCKKVSGRIKVNRAH